MRGAQAHTEPTGGGPPAPARGRLDGPVGLGLGLVSLAGALALRGSAGLWGAAGTDAALWGLTAEDLRVGAAPLVPPLYPAAIAALRALGAAPWEAGRAISTAAAALVPALVWAVARAGGAPRAAAGAAAVGVLVHPDLALWGQQVQPEALTAALTLGLGLALAGLPGPRAAAFGAAAAAGLMPLLREHGVPMALLVGGALAARRRTWPAAGLLLAVGLAGAPLLGGGPAWAPSWGDRAGGALSALLTRDPAELSFLRELHRADRARYAALVEAGDLGARLLWHAGRSLRLAPDGWALLLGALLGAARPAGRRLLLPLLTALPALLIWSQRRHVLVLAPLAAAAAAVGVGALPPRARAVAAVALAALIALPPAPRWAPTVRGLQSEVPRARHYAEAGAFLCEQAPQPALLCGVFQDIGLYCPKPRHDPDGSPADWLAVCVSDRPPRGGAAGPWAEVWAGAGPLRAWRLDPDRDPRPCADARPDPRAAHLAVGAAHVDLLACAPAP
jgi:hypothetical protein